MCYRQSLPVTTLSVCGPVHRKVSSD